MTEIWEGVRRGLLGLLGRLGGFAAAGLWLAEGVVVASSWLGESIGVRFAMAREGLAVRERRRRERPRQPSAARPTKTTKMITPGV